MRKLILGALLLLSMVSCQKVKSCNCGTIVDNPIVGNQYGLTILNDCDGISQTFYFSQDVWIHNYVGDYFCKSNITNQSNTVAKIHVKDENNLNVSNAMVVLYGEIISGTSVISFMDTIYTDVNGVVTFDLNSFYNSGQMDISILDIKAQKLNKIGIGTISIESRKINETVISINP